MHKLHNKHRRYDLAGDVERIKAALWDTTKDLQGTAGQMLNDSYNSMKEKATETQENVSDYVTEKPFVSVGLALGLGVVIGYFLHR